MESTLLKMPKDAMGTISDALHLMRLEEEIRASHYGPALASLNVREGSCSVVLDDRYGLDPAKAKTLNASEAAIITVYRIFFSAAHLQEVKMECRIDNQPELILTVERKRAESLIGPDGVTAVRRNWQSIWDYLRPIIKQPEFAIAVKNYLSGASEHNPINAGTYADDTNWLKKAFPR
jgi:hypothetical protein